MASSRARGLDRRILALLFGLRTRVGPWSYLAAGLSLALLKYLLEAALVHAATGTWMSPLRFLSPFLSQRYPNELGLTGVLVLHLPFLWIGATMTIRRAIDTGLSPIVGLLFFVPFVNLILFAALSLAPSRTNDLPEAPTERRRQDLDAERRAERAEELRSAFLAIASTLPVTAILVLLLSLGLEQYGGTLFLGAPFVLGFFGGWYHNRGEARSFRSNACVALASVLVCGGAIFVCAVEGAICLALVLPLGLPLTLLGVLFGAALARHRRSRLQPMLSLVLLPALGALEASVAAPRPYSVTTALEIDAPPERVWSHVIAFPALPQERHWLFHTGIAYPTGATIEGRGVGALRRCEFSTGTFVEPITAWDEPALLAFDVALQPDPMRELSPWGALRPPHLERGFRSERGEFRLIALAGGRTRLEGTTWYALDLHPSWYWRLVAQPIVHRIHLRVLEHVRALAEG